MSTSFPTQDHHVVYMCPDVIFQILLPPSRPYDVTCLFIIQKKRKEQKKKNKIPIKLENKRKRK